MFTAGCQSVISPHSLKPILSGLMLWWAVEWLGVIIGCLPGCGYAVCNAHAGESAEPLSARSAGGCRVPVMKHTRYPARASASGQDRRWMLRESRWRARAVGQRDAHITVTCCDLPGGAAERRAAGAAM